MDNQFITKDTLRYTPQDVGDEDDISNKFHYINFEIPIFSKRYIRILSNKLTVLKFAEFNIGLKFIDNMIISSRREDIDNNY